MEERRRTTETLSILQYLALSSSNFVSVQEDALVSLTSAHELHPFSWRDRFIVLFNYLAWVYLLSVIVATRNFNFVVSSAVVAFASAPYYVLLRGLVEVRCCVGCEFAEEVRQCSALRSASLM